MPLEMFDDAWRLEPSVDHFIPRFLGGADGPTHIVHLYCQKVQGGWIGGPIAGKISGRIAVESGHMARMNANLTTKQRSRIQKIGAPLGGKIGGPIGGKITGRRNVESGHWARIQPLGGKISGRIAVESGQLARLNAALTPEQRSRASKIGTCIRWNKSRGKPCVCGRHGTP